MVHFNFKRENKENGCNNHYSEPEYDYAKQRNISDNYLRNINLNLSLFIRGVSHLNFWNRSLYKHVYCITNVISSDGIVTSSKIYIDKCLDMLNGFHFLNKSIFSFKEKSGNSLRNVYVLCEMITVSKKIINPDLLICKLQTKNNYNKNLSQINELIKNDNNYNRIINKMQENMLDILNTQDIPKHNIGGEVSTYFSRGNNDFSNRGVSRSTRYTKKVDFYFELFIQ